MPVMISYTLEEFKRIEKAFPGLYYNQKPNFIKGILKFSSRYKKASHTTQPQWYIEPCEPNEDGCVEGEYSIDINLGKQDRYSLPKVFETGGKIEKCKRKLNIATNDDMHLNGDCSCCLGIYSPQEVSKLSLYKFVVEEVYPYFVWQAYFEKYEKEPPCGALPHSYQKALSIRIREVENDLKSLQYEQKGRPKGSHRNQLCPCGSGLKYKVCCLRQDEKIEAEITSKKCSIIYFKKELKLHKDTTHKSVFPKCRKRQI